MIDVENLSFTYPNAKSPTLDNLSFSIAKGEVYGLLGPSGSGKSTTQKILMGLLRGFTGKATIFNQPVETMGRALYERIGVSFELPTLYLRLTALENLKLFAALYDRPTRNPLDILKLVDLQDAANQRVEAFSKGMKMRLNLCRSLLHDPDLLFFDEPTSGQDPSRARVTRDLIKRLKSEGKTIFLTTHNMAEADEICDIVAFLADGTIPVSDKPEALKRKYGQDPSRARVTRDLIKRLKSEGKTIFLTTHNMAEADEICDVVAFLADGTIPVSDKPEALKRKYGQRILEVGVNAREGVEKVAFPMDDIGTNGEFIELLGTGAVVSMHTLEASLDDVFIKATNGKAKAA